MLAMLMMLTSFAKDNVFVILTKLAEVRKLFNCSEKNNCCGVTMWDMIVMAEKFCCCAKIDIVGGEVIA